MKTKTKVPKFQKADDFDMEAAVKYMQHYWNTYDKQTDYKNWGEDMFLRDALYGVGVALDEEKYKWANGFEQFIDDLRKRIFANVLKDKRTL